MKYEQIKPYIEDKLVSEQAHPEYPNFRIFNYTHKAQFKQAWDDVTKQCRGLILDVAHDSVIARPFPKFFNLEEHRVGKEKVFFDVEGIETVITEKYDGSLGILYHLEGVPYIATRGSFTSEQAVWATQWLREHVTEQLPIHQTMLFEIIWKPNRIVVNYDFEGLVHLTTRDTQTGDDLYPNYHVPEPILRPEEIHVNDIDGLQKLAEDNKEGFVVFFPEHNARLKVKFDEYVRLHKILTGLSEKGAWEYLQENGVDADIMKIAEDAPDEFYAWLKEVALNMKFKYKAIEAEARQDYAKLYEEGLERKELAERFKKCRYPQILFAELDSKPWEHLIWKLIRPHGKTMTVFKQDIDA